MNYDNLTTLGIAFGLGLLVGIQRETPKNDMAGVRTFTIITILGVTAGFLTRAYDNPFILPVLGLSVAALMMIANVIKSRNTNAEDVGQTTEVAALLMFAVGAYLVVGDQIIGVVIGTSIAILLHIKERLHGFIENLKPKDLSAIMTLAGIALVVLPILPDKNFGPYDVINPRNIWLMITLIVGISVFGYFIYKLFGKKVGIISNGILGGLISSTATTVSYARKTADAADISKLAVFVITTASTVSFIRILLEVGIVIPNHLNVIAMPIGAVIIIMALTCVVLYYVINKDKSAGEEMPEPENPAQFKSALIFGLLYGFILLAVAFTKEKFGNNALYIVAILSGLTDVDAITLSLSQLIKEGSLKATFGWKLILLAGLSNMMFKGIMAIVLGAKQLMKWIVITFGITITSGLLIMWFWPESWHL